MMPLIACPPCIGRCGKHTTAACFGHIAQTPSRNWKEARADIWEGGLIKSQAPTPPFPRIGSEFFSLGGRSSLFHSLYAILHLFHSLYDILPHLFHSLYATSHFFTLCSLFTTPFFLLPPYLFSFYTYQRYSNPYTGHVNLRLFPFFFLFLRLHFHISSRVLLSFYWLFRGTD